MKYDELLTLLNNYLNGNNIYVIGNTNIQEYTPNTGILIFKEGVLEGREKLLTSYSLFFTFLDLFVDYKKIYDFIKTVLNVLSFIGALDISYSVIVDSGLDDKILLTINFDFRVLDTLSVVDYKSFI